MATNVVISGETPITIKLSVGDAAKKIKLPLKDLTAEVLPAKLITVLGIPNDKKVTFERFSDSAGKFVQLDANNSAVYKTLVRAAKAKLKLRLRATVEGQEPSVSSEAQEIPVKKWQPNPQRTNIGAGIFDFKDNRADGTSKLTMVPNEAPLPLPFTASASVSGCHPQNKKLERLGFDASPASAALDILSRPVIAGPTWSIYCNECDTAMLNEHYHCGICDGGDYDLCLECVKNGKLCPGDNHWLVKRSLKDGQIICSTTERLEHKPKPKMSVTDASVRQSAQLVNDRTAQVAQKVFSTNRPSSSTLAIRSTTSSAVPPTSGSPSTRVRRLAPLAPAAPSASSRGMPGAYTDDAQTLREESIQLTRTCNCCIMILPEAQFVHCDDCEDYDLCLSCHAAKKHGHHPGHRFSCAVKSQNLTSVQAKALAPGNGVRHYAICDGCDKNIVGVRHKCFQCPDFDYCSECFASANTIHPGHRFAAIYEPIVARYQHKARHVGIFCDGLTCSSQLNQAYIEGVRYKCAICPDTDFCANCEAHPHNTHNPTHPLIKISTPVARLHVSTINREGPNNVRTNLGDDATRASPQPAQPVVVKPVSSASSVKTVAHIEPTVTSLKEEVAETGQNFTAKPNDELNAHFVSDTIPDGIVVRAGTRFTQVWNMVNPGPATWPAGCSVRFTGGDNMLNVDDQSPFTAAVMNEATESNIVGREVLPGEHVAFKVVLKAPAREGKAISYWRLKAADGTPFGHRLWCDVNVRVVPAQSEFAAQAAASMTMPARIPHPETFYQPAPGSAEREEFIRIYKEKVRQWAARRQSADVSTKRSNDNNKGSPVSTHTYEHLSQLGSCVQPTFTSSPSEKRPTAVEQVIEPAETVKSVQKPIKEAPTASESPMVYPTLDKESPASSTYLSTSSRGDSKGKAATVEDEQTGVVTSAEKTSADNEEEVFQDIASEIEVLSASSAFSDNDDGFLTDEEYDILDASDQETVA